MAKVVQHTKIFFVLENNIPFKCCVNSTGGHMCVGSHTRPVLNVLSFVQKKIKRKKGHDVLTHVKQLVNKRTNNIIFFTELK